MHMVVLRVAVDGAALQDGKTQYFYCPIWDDDLETPLESKIDEVRWLLFCECRIGCCLQIATFCGFDPGPGMSLSVGSAIEW